MGGRNDYSHLYAFQSSHNMTLEEKWHSRLAVYRHGM